MKRQYIRKTIVGLLLIAISAGASFLIKDFLDAQHPENSLPIIRVNCGYDMQNVQLAGFRWDFITAKNKVWPSEEPPGLPLVISTVQPSTPITISFSDEKALKKTTVSRSDGIGISDYAIQDGLLVTPTTPGVYTYRIDSEFSKGEITYFFRVDVLEQ